MPSNVRLSRETCYWGALFIALGEELYCNRKNNAPTIRSAQVFRFRQKGSSSTERRNKPMGTGRGEAGEAMVGSGLEKVSPRGRPAHKSTGRWLRQRVPREGNL